MLLTADKSARRAARIASAVLVIGTLLLYSRAANNGFVGYDDPKYVTENSRVLSGISPGNVIWAFNVGYFSSWHPLTWLSHMLDAQVFGVRAWGHHATSVVLFAVSVWLLFKALYEGTGALYPSALAAAVWAWHPLRVQSVAWVSERKDVLAILFGLCALLAYTRYCRRPTRLRYLLVLLATAASLMSKAMWVTLPAVLILWDIWPMRRWSARDVRGLIMEKLPLLALCAAASALTYLAQARGGAVSAGAIYTPALRLQNAVVAYARYLLKFIWPVDLAAYYPYPAGEWSLNAVAISAMVLMGITTCALLLWRRRPYLAIGWFWYLGMLIPMIGIVQVGSQSMADRYTLAPMIGISFAAVWLLREVMPGGATTRAVAFGAILLALAGRTWVEIGYWRDTYTLFSRTHEVTGGSFISHGFLGTEHARRKDDRTAEIHFREALRLNPRYAEVHFNLGNLLMRRQDFVGSAEHFSQAVKYMPGMAEGHNNLGVSLARIGRMNEALEAFRRASELRPESAEFRRNVQTAEAATRPATQESR